MSAPVADLTVAYYQAQAAVSAAAMVDVATAWAEMQAARVVVSWSEVAPSVLQAIVARQLQSASIPATYVAAVLDVAQLRPEPVGVIAPESFAGRTASGDSLRDAVAYAPVVTLDELGRGVAPQDALARGLRHLQTIAATEVADAGRGAVEAAVRLEPQIVGYERYVNLPCCSRCLLLAGRVYKKSTGFLRHPRCDCAMRPLTSRAARDDTDQEPPELFASLTEAEQNRMFTADGARAIRSGADIYRVVNARSGMSSPGDRFTTAGRGRRKAQPSRLSPQGIARLAGDDDALYLRLLRRNRYL